jgi:phosphatidylinositol dimannoside acyltransferase
MIARAKAPFTTVMERLEPESVYEQFLAFRESLGMEVLPASGGASPFGVLAQRLRAGKLVVLPCDRDVTGSGIEVDFFGEKALMMGGPAALAVQTGAALMPVTLWFKTDGWGAHIHEEIPVPAEGSRREKVLAMMQDVAKVFEAGIRAHPEDWHMLQRVFVADLDLARLARAEAKARAAAADGDGVSADGNGTGTGRGPGEMAGGRTALDGQPNGSGP